MLIWHLFEVKSKAVNDSKIVYDYLNYYLKSFDFDFNLIVIKV